MNESPLKRKKSESHGTAAAEHAASSSPKLPSQPFPITPTLEFSLSPGLSAMMSPPFSFMQSTQMPSSRDWSPTMNNLMSMPENFSFPEVPTSNRPISKSYPSEMESHPYAHPQDGSVDSVARENLLHNKRALADRISKGRNQVDTSQLMPPTGPLAKINSATSTSSVKRGIAENAVDDENFVLSAQLSITSMSGLEAITAAAHTVEMESPTPTKPEAGAKKGKRTKAVADEPSRVDLSATRKTERKQLPSPYDKKTRDKEALTSPEPYTSSLNGTSPTSAANVACNCKKSRCLKMYCDCFRLRQYCRSSCNCKDCANAERYELERNAAISAILDRNPEAFKPRVTEDPTSSAKGHLTGCHCRKSSCLKKYCECFTGSVPCGDRCRCVDCKNMADMYRPDFQYKLDLPSAASATSASAVVNTNSNSSVHSIHSVHSNQTASTQKSNGSGSRSLFQSLYSENAKPSLPPSGQLRPPQKPLVVSSTAGNAGSSDAIAMQLASYVKDAPANENSNLSSSSIESYEVQYNSHFGHHNVPPIPGQPAYFSHVMQQHHQLQQQQFSSGGGIQIDTASMLVDEYSNDSNLAQYLTASGILSMESPNISRTNTLLSALGGPYRDINTGTSTATADTVQRSDDELSQHSAANNAVARVHPYAGSAHNSSSDLRQHYNYESPISTPLRTSRLMDPPTTSVTTPIAQMDLAQRNEEAQLLLSLSPCKPVPGINHSTVGDSTPK